MENYKGSIELISGIKQKNNGSFALVEAGAIQVDAEDTRLDVKLESIDSRLTELGEQTVDAETVMTIVLEDENFKTLQSDVNNMKGEVESLGTDLGTLDDELLALKDRVDDFRTNEYDIELDSVTNTLYLYENGDTENPRSQVVLPAGGGGGSTSATTIKFTRITPEIQTVLFGNDFNLEYSFTSTYEDGESSGAATAQWYVGSRLVATETIAQSIINSFNIGPSLSAGSNTVKITITDSEGTSVSRRWTITAIDMYIESSFDDGAVYSEDVTFRYVPYGDISKTIHFELDGDAETLGTTTVTTSGRTQTITIPRQSHGAHSLKVWATAVVGSETISTNSLYFDIMFVEDGNNTPIIGCAYDGSDAEQYTSKIFEYYVYTPGNLNSSVVLAIDGETVSTLTVNRLAQQWNYKPLDFGDKVLTITTSKTVGEETFTATKTLNVKVNKFAYADDIHPVTTGLGLDFNPAGRTNNDENREEFTYGSYSMSLSENFDWQNGGWKIDEDGNSYFCVKAGTWMSIDYPLFGDNVTKTSGKNFKMIYKATDCRDFNAEVMNCFMNEIGVIVTAQNAKVTAGGTSVELPYVEDRYMELEFNIQPDASHGSYSEMLGIIDGDYSRVSIYQGTDNFNQTTTNTDKAFAPIKFGSPDCDLWLYRFKAYNIALDDDEIMDNRIADAPDAEDMANRFIRNNITTDGELDIEKIANICPDLRIILITCPRFTTGKKDKVPDCSVQQIFGKEGQRDPKHNWNVENVVLSGQGTSSDNYGDSSRNMDINCKSNFIYSDGTESEMYAMTSNSIGANYFNIKVNVASSENANNSRFQEDYHVFQPYIRPARQANPKVRDTMEFHPCVVFVQETGKYADGTVAEVQEFAADGKFHFYSCGDFGNSKKNNHVMGMNPENPLECIVEVSNNIADPCRFKSDDLTNEAWDGEFAFEFRYPDIEEDVTAEQAQVLKDNFQRLLSWVVSTDRLQATNNELSAEQRAEVLEWRNKFTSTDPEYEQYTNLTTDSAEYRAAKFVNQFDDYFVSDSVMYHYLFTERHCMIDNRAKNTFIHTEDGIHWDYVFDYDNDTADGNDNEGGLTLDYGLEDTDTIGSKDVYNAADSVIWVNTRDLFNDRLTAMFLDRESAGAWNASRIINMFDTYQGVKPERLVIADMRRKYLRPYETAGTTSYLPMLYGKKQLQRARFETYQENYMSSKYTGSVCTSDVLTLRTYTPNTFISTEEGGVTPKGEMDITPYCDMYVNLKVGGTSFKQRAKRGDVVHFDFSDMRLNDTETYVYSCSKVQELGDLSPLYVGYCNFSQATKLSTIIIGSNQPKYSNTNLESVGFSANRLLSYLDIRNCTSEKLAGNALDLTGCIGLKEIYTTGSNFPGISFADGGLLETAQLNGLKSLSVKNLNYIKEFTLTTYENLTDLIMENCNSLNSYTFVQNCPNLRILRLTGITHEAGFNNSWRMSSTDLLDSLLKLSGFDESGLTTEQSVLAGSAYVQTMRPSSLRQFEVAWQDLALHYETLMTEYVVTFKNYDDSVIYSKYVDAGSTISDPLTTGEIASAPVRPADAQYSYTFNKWDFNFATRIQSDITIYPVYDSTIRTYSVKWIANEEILQEVQAEYGSSVEYSGETPTRTQEEANLVYYLFDGWDKSTGFISGDTIVNALWDRGTVPAEGTFLHEMRPVEIYAVVKSGNASKYFENEDYIDIKLGYNPSYEGVEEVVLAEEAVFDGTNAIDTGIALFDEDKDWTIYIDFEFDYVTSTDEQVLMGCYQEGGTEGFLLSSKSNSIPVLKWNGISTSLDSQKASSSATYRNSVVFKHRKGDFNLYVYLHGENNDRYTTSEMIIVPMEKARITTTSLTLSLGGRSYGSDIFSNQAKGKIHYAKLWYADLSDKECKKIASWISNNQRFVYYGAPMQYLLTDGDHIKDFCNAVFIAENLLDRTYTMQLGSTNAGGWAVTEMRTWLHNKFFVAIPDKWKMIIKQVELTTNTGYSNGTAYEIATSSDFIFLPSVMEIGGETAGNNTVVSGTEYVASEAKGQMPQFTDLESRKKYLKNGESTTSTGWWLRTASISRQSLWWNVSSSGEIVSYTSMGSNLGICPCFAI